MSDFSRVVVVLAGGVSGGQLSSAVTQLGYRAESYQYGRHFIEHFDHSDVREKCLILDDELPDMSALELLTALVDHGIPIPVVLTSKSLSSFVAVAAMRRGAVNCVVRTELLDNLDVVLEDAFEQAPNVSKIHEARKHHERFGRLKETEKAIVGLAAVGMPNKRIASKMQLSVKTVEKYRRQAYATLGVNNTASMTRAITLHSMHNMINDLPDSNPQGAGVSLQPKKHWA